ncbi:MAG TPA: Flp pilus assembly protein CpaB [Pseudolabrys sp.]|jgi:pilus assembly protein CpaB|nr:Flp pilus assembly protein CpaB [Pseudolabrys sp.]
MKAARLVVLIVALGAGGVAAVLAGRTSKHPAAKTPAAPKMATVDVLVAKADIDAGRKISPSDVKWQAWPADANTGNFIRRKQHPTAIESLSGSIVRAPFVAGEPIRQQKLVQAKGSGYMAAILPSGMRAISIGVSPESGASGFILPNDHVDVVLTERDRQAEKATGTQAYTSHTILNDVRVLAIDQTVTDKEGKKVVVGKTATLELTPRQVETVELARKVGSLSLALRSIADIGKKTPVADDNLRPEHDAVNVVRFGVTTTITPR